MDETLAVASVTSPFTAEVAVLASSLCSRLDSSVGGTSGIFPEPLEGGTEDDEFADRFDMDGDQDNKRWKERTSALAYFCQEKSLFLLQS